MRPEAKLLCLDVGWAVHLLPSLQDKRWGRHRAQVGGEESQPGPQRLLSGFCLDLRGLRAAEPGESGPGAAEERKWRPGSEARWLVVSWLCLVDANRQA